MTEETPTKTRKRPAKFHAKSGYRRGETQNERKKAPSANGGSVPASAGGSPRSPLVISAAPARPSTPGPVNSSRGDPSSACAVTAPATMATYVIIPTAPATRPRACSGTRSARTACSADSVALMPSWVIAQPIPRTATLWARPVISRPPRPAAMPPITQGRRRPKRDVVRSDSAPKSGPPISARKPPTARTVLSEEDLPSGSSCPTRRDSETVTGVNSASEMRNCAATRRTAKPVL
ncbi:hypothetical protein GCM10020295_80890 [Streptomyces cinereospinus]